MHILRDVVLIVLIIVLIVAVMVDGIVAAVGRERRISRTFACTELPATPIPITMKITMTLTDTDNNNHNVEKKQ